MDFGIPSKKNHVFFPFSIKKIEKRDLKTNYDRQDDGFSFLFPTFAETST